jgi:hypothetical protein
VRWWWPWPANLPLIEMLVGAFADVLQVLDGDPTDAETGPLVKQAVAQHGDIR